MANLIEGLFVGIVAGISVYLEKYHGLPWYMVYASVFIAVLICGVARPKSAKNSPVGDYPPVRKRK